MLPQFSVRILVLDDEQGFCSLLQRTLQRLGHEAVAASLPSQAMALLDSRIDGVITDIHMPEMDGVEFAQKVRERLGPVPIAFCTGSEPDDQMVQQAAEIGRILPKLWTLDQVMATLEEFRDTQQVTSRSRR